MLPRFPLAIGLLSIALSGCQANDFQQQNGSGDDVQMAVAQIAPTRGNSARGNVTLTQMGQRVKVVGEISGLRPGQKHAIHIHEGTECGEDGMKAGDHYNPSQHPHGLPDAKNRHAGDWGNLTANDQGVATINLTVENISLTGSQNSVLGRCVVVHEKADDGSQPTGNAGGRIGCGKIQPALGEKK